MCDPKGPLTGGCSGQIQFVILCSYFLCSLVLYFSAVCVISHVGHLPSQDAFTIVRSMKEVTMFLRCLNLTANWIDLFLVLSVSIKALKHK